MPKYSAAPTPRPRAAGMTGAMFAELKAVAAMANQTSALANPFRPQTGARISSRRFSTPGMSPRSCRRRRVARTMREQPQRLLDALSVIAKSEANYAHKAVAAGASGVFLAVANAQDAS